jgi:hypothetical protein
LEPVVGRAIFVLSPVTRLRDADRIIQIHSPLWLAEAQPVVASAALSLTGWFYVWVPPLAGVAGFLDPVALEGIVGVGVVLFATEEIRPLPHAETAMATLVLSTRIAFLNFTTSCGCGFAVGVAGKNAIAGQVVKEIVVRPLAF